MAAGPGDAHPFPIYNARFRVIFPILDNTGALVPSAAGLDSEVNRNSGIAANCVNEATELIDADTDPSGMYYLDLVATELDTKSSTIRVQTTTTDAKTTPIVLYPKRLPVLRTGTAQAGAGSTITLDAGASAKDGFYNGCYVNITNDSPANARGQARLITGYVGSTKVATVESAWGTNPSSASTFEILLPGETVNVAQWVGQAVADPNTDGVPKTDLVLWLGTAPLALASQLVQVSVGALQAGVITAASIAAGAFASAKFAADYFTDTGVAVWASATRTLTSFGTLVADVATAVWGAAARTLTSLAGNAADIRAAVGLAAANLDTQLGSIQSGVTAIGILVSTNLDATVSSRATPAQVNTEVLDVLTVDIFGEPTGVPGATVSLAEKIGRLYMVIRNGILVDSNTGKIQFLDDGGAAEWEKDFADAAGVYTESEANSP